MNNNLSDLLKSYKISFYQTLFSPLLDLAERGFMTPTFLSNLIMKLILPAQWLIPKTRDLTSFDMPNYPMKPCTHHWNKLEILEVRSEKEDSQEFEIFFCGNGQDAIDSWTIENRVEANPNKHIIFWNYPGVGTSQGPVHSTQDLFKAGYRIAKGLLDKGILAEQITLHGFSLGGGVATHVARCLHEEGHFVHLEVNRSFGRISSVIPEQINNINFPRACAPFITSALSFSIWGLSLGTTISGLFATLSTLFLKTVKTATLMIQFSVEVIGIFFENIITIMGRIIAFPFHFVSEFLTDSIKSLFSFIGEFLNTQFYLTGLVITSILNAICWSIDNIMHLFLSIAGGAIAIAGAITGILVSLFVGAILSLQHLWTKNPLTIPINPAFQALLNSTCCEMDSIYEMHRLLNADQNPQNKNKVKPKITVINTINDEVIPIQASLNRRLTSSERITSRWYLFGGHMNRLRKEINTDEQNWSLNYA